MTLIKNFPEFSIRKVNNFILAKLFILEHMQWVFKAFYAYYLFSHGNYQVIEYIFHLWWQHMSAFHAILFIPFILLSYSLIILSSQL